MIHPVDPRLTAEIGARPERILFASVAGEHLYGMAAPGTDPDVRACHVLPAADVVGLRAPQETIAFTGHRDGLDFEYVSHDLKKFALLLLKKNGNVLEHVCSPLVVRADPGHEEFRAVALACASRHLATHFQSHARMQWELAARDGAPTIRGALLALRALMAGIHLMETGTVESRLPRLARTYGLTHAPGWVERRVADGDDARLHDDEAARAASQMERLETALERARDASPLPPAATDAARDRLDALLVRLRLG